MAGAPVYLKIASNVAPVPSAVTVGGDMGACPTVIGSLNEIPESLRHYQLPYQRIVQIKIRGVI